MVTPLIQGASPGDEPGDISHFQAPRTALAATVGTGNITAVATAIATGGRGAMAKSGDSLPNATFVPGEVVASQEPLGKELARQVALYRRNEIRSPR